MQKKEIISIIIIIAKKRDYKYNNYMVNNNSTTFIVSEKVGLVLGKCARKILVISGIGLLVRFILKKSSGGN